MPKPNKQIRIYGLHAGDGEIRYVGKTINSLTARLRGHRNSSRNPKNKHWPVYRWFQKHNNQISILEIEIVSSKDDWKEREAYWIREFASGRNLNIGKGGEGYPGGAFSEEHRKNISKALTTGRWEACSVCETPFWMVKSSEGKKRFCSRKCQGFAGRGRVTRNAFPASALVAAAAKRRAISHCPQGHPYEGDNLRTSSTNRRICRACSREATRQHRIKKRATL